MLTVIFYDRKNKRKVKNTELVSVALHREVWCGNSQEPEEKYPGSDHLQLDVVANLGYKSDECPTSQNWDKWCNIGDLVFIELKDEEDDV